VEASPLATLAGTPGIKKTRKQRNYSSGQDEEMFVKHCGKLPQLFLWIKGGAESFNSKKKKKTNQQTLMPKYYLWCNYSLL